MREVLLVINLKEGNPKSTYALLAFSLGGFGAHKFYFGQIGIGVLY